MVSLVVEPVHFTFKCQTQINNKKVKYYYKDESVQDVNKVLPEFLGILLDMDMTSWTYCIISNKNTLFLTQNVPNLSTFFFSILVKKIFAYF